ARAAALALPAAAAGLAVGWALARGPTATLLATLNEVPPGVAVLVPLGLALVAIVALVVACAAWPAWRATAAPPAALLRGGGRRRRAGRSARRRRSPSARTCAWSPSPATTSPSRRRRSPPGAACARTARPRSASGWPTRWGWRRVGPSASSCRTGARRASAS